MFENTNKYKEYVGILVCLKSLCVSEIYAFSLWALVAVLISISNDDNLLTLAYIYNCWPHTFVTLINHFFFTLKIMLSDKNGCEIRIDNAAKPSQSLCMGILYKCVIKEHDLIVELI